MLSTLQAALIYALLRHFEDDLTMDRPTLMQIEVCDPRTDRSNICTFLSFLDYSVQRRYRWADGSRGNRGYPAGLGRMDFGRVKASVCLCSIHVLYPKKHQSYLTRCLNRTMITLYIFDASFHHSRGLKTLTSYELGELPLPTIKDLWEGTDRANWEVEYERYLAGLKGERLPQIQDAWSRNLIFGEWYAGMDAFGVTVLALTQSCPNRIHE